LVLVLTWLYQVALPHSLPWHRLLPGALLAMVVFITSTTGLRVYIAVLTSTGYTYGALATPIAFLLFAFLLGLSIVLGAHLNNAVEEVWPARRRERRLHRILAVKRVATRLVAGRRSAGGSVSGEPAKGDLPHGSRPTHAAAAGHAGSHAGTEEP
jgi:membrane protein